MIYLITNKSILTKGNVSNLMSFPSSGIFSSAFGNAVILINLSLNYKRCVNLKNKMKYLNKTK